MDHIKTFGDHSEEADDSGLKPNARTVHGSPHVVYTNQPASYHYSFMQPSETWAEISGDRSQQGPVVTNHLVLNGSRQTSNTNPFNGSEMMELFGDYKSSREESRAMVVERRKEAKRVDRKVDATIPDGESWHSPIEP